MTDNKIKHLQNLMLAKQYLEESIKISKEFKTDNAVIADFMKNQTEIFQQISDLIEPEEIVEEIELIAKSRTSNDAKPNEKK
ncbi:MAG: hypothetical protein HOE93_01745 [Nitrosopumilus sp.]|nr:hypothetical protein [Nitrosopumilus sp.]MBT3574402.1 hypothetical protein [Nitrosopumilus sp.]MBT3956023.1 hypothetical protein [Nitrosopumilus sp.]MBT4299079.1 hypothetical protein [Nitrosopumilus sp.]MBT4535110.1 hypothetical protein [Nitrosopumilus sp.]